MTSVRDFRRGRRAAFAWAATVGLLPLSSIVVPGTASAQSDPPAATAVTHFDAAPPAVSAPVTLPVFTLDQCLAVAYQRQPALAAARASLAQKQIGYAAIAKPSLAAHLTSEIDIRRGQSAQGVAAATAELALTEAETKYAVTRTYFTAIYAKLQLDVAGEVANNIGVRQQTIDNAIKQGASGGDINTVTLYRLTVNLKLAEARKGEAAAGMERALAALREAMAVGGDCMPFQLADRSLPILLHPVEKCEIIRLALSRRGELQQVRAAAAASALEIQAQDRFRLRPSFRTYAGSADIHSKPIPPGLHNGDYKPGAIGVEMPPALVGNRSERVGQAAALSERQNAVVSKTHELLQLEAEDAYIKWSEATGRVGLAREAAQSGTKLAERLREDKQNLPPDKVREEDLVQAEVVAGQSRGEFNRAVFDLILALANLERVTSGGFPSGLGVQP